MSLADVIQGQALLSAIACPSIQRESFFETGDRSDRPPVILSGFQDLPE